MVGRRHGEIGLTAELAIIVDQRFIFFREQQLSDPSLKRNRPGKGLLHVPAPCVRVKVMDEVTASDDKNAVLAQNCQSLAKVKVERSRLRFVNTELNNRNVCERIDVAEDRPCTVVQAPSIV